MEVSGADVSHGREIGNLSSGVDRRDGHGRDGSYASRKAGADCRTYGFSVFLYLLSPFLRAPLCLIHAGDEAANLGNDIKGQSAERS
ncbi:hypothetical protein D3C81_1860520 [compost metagenome]